MEVGDIEDSTDWFWKEIGKHVIGFYNLFHKFNNQSGTESPGQVITNT